jgi:hypothetical protein
MTAIDSIPATASRSVSPPAPINLARLSYSELRELLQSALEKHPDIGPSISEAIARVDARELAESQKAPPPVDYNSLRSTFYKEAHSMDPLESMLIYIHGHRLMEPLRECIQAVAESVNKNSPRKTIEEAFLCLENFVSQLQYLDPEVSEQLIPEDGGILNDICYEMQTVAELLKEKGGMEDLELEENIKEYIKEYAEVTDNGGWVDFKQVYNTLWGHEGWLVSDEDSEDD